MYIKLFSSVVVISISAYLTKKYLFRPKPTPQKQTRFRFTKCIGKLAAIIIYPLDGGYPYYVKEATCSMSGLQHDDLVNKSWVAYSPTTKVAILNLHDPKIATTKIDILLDELRNPQRKFRLQKEIVINYLGKRMLVQDEGDDIATIAQNIFGYSSSDMRIAYCSPQNRSISEINQIVPSGSTNIIDILSPYYSDYTLIHSNSLAYIEKQTGEHIAPSRFRANLVFEGSEPEFCEDDLQYLTIGSNLFAPIFPCTHTPSAFLDQANVPNSEQLEPYNFLKKNRTLKDLRSGSYEFDSPTFGINMFLINPKPGKIKLGDEVNMNVL